MFRNFLRQVPKWFRSQQTVTSSFNLSPRITHTAASTMSMHHSSYLMTLATLSTSAVASVAQSQNSELEKLKQNMLDEMASYGHKKILNYFDDDNSHYRKELSLVLSDAELCDSYKQALEEESLTAYTVTKIIEHIGTNTLPEVDLNQAGTKEILIYLLQQDCAGEANIGYRYGIMNAAMHHHTTMVNIMINAMLAAGHDPRCILDFWPAYMGFNQDEADKNKLTKDFIKENLQQVAASIIEPKTEIEKLFKADPDYTVRDENKSKIMDDLLKELDERLNTRKFN